MGKDSLRSDESRFRQSERMVAIWAERKSQRAEATTVPKIEEAPEIVAQIVRTDVATAIDPDFIPLEEQAIAALMPAPGRADGLALAPIGMFDVARYHRLKKFYAKRKASAQGR